MAVKEESNLAKKAEEKSSEVKFSDEELKSLRDLQDGYQEKQAQFEKTEEQFQKDYVGLQEKEQEIVRKLNEKYGPGTLDPQTGVFTPTPVETSETT